MSDARESISEQTYELAPVAQTGFICFYSGSTLTIYTAALYIQDWTASPPWFYLPSLLGFYLAVFSSFYFKGFRAIRNFIKQLILNADRGMSGLPPIVVPRDPEKPLSVQLEQMGQADRFPRSQALRVQATGAAAVLFAAWLCAYSGGPFESPAGQFLFSLPLLSPVIARDWRSIAAIYAFTGLVALTALKLPHRAFQQSTNWLIAAVLVVLFISGLIAARIKQQQSKSVHRAAEAASLD